MNRVSLKDAADRFGTPLYVYDTEMIFDRFKTLRTCFEGRFDVSFAVKSNPNVGLLSAIRDEIVTYDVSSFAEVERAIRAGASPKNITFSGPVKKQEEIKNSVLLGIGELVVESVSEAKTAARAAQSLHRTQTVLLRINPIKCPRAFGVNMAGKPSQFGVDEEDMETAIETIDGLAGLSLEGFHIYSGTNSLSADAIAENFGNFIEIFQKAAKQTGKSPKKLVFGSGFGVPYLPDDTPLDVQYLSTLVNPMIDAFKAEPVFSKTDLVLEMGRWLFAPAGWLVSSVVAEKSSRGTELRLCDAGFNNHLAACGMMGSVFRRNWRIHNVSSPDAPKQTYTLNGPLCTTIDVLATDIEMPELNVGDLIAIENSGAYGLTASPTRFISHPEPREVMFMNGAMQDVTESLLNHWKPSESQDTAKVDVLKAKRA